MSIITTTRSYERDGNFTFTVAAKNGYGIDPSLIPSMQHYLVDDSERRDPIGEPFAGSLNNNNQIHLYPGARISGQLKGISVNYALVLQSSEDQPCRELMYGIKFQSDPHPGTGDPVFIDDVVIPGVPDLEHYRWHDNPLILPTAVPSTPDASITFATWRCVESGMPDRYYNAGSRIFVNNDMSFFATWVLTPVEVSVESDNDNSDIPEFENE